jgi:hypothetical protein
MILRSLFRREYFLLALPGRTRRGAILADVGLAAIILLVAMSLMLKVLAIVAHERRAADHRQRAALEVANLMERITAYPFERVTPELARGMTLSETARQSLRDCELAIDVTGGERVPLTDRDARRISITLRWREPSGQWQHPVRLTSWIEHRRVGS